MHGSTWQVAMHVGVDTCDPGPVVATMARHIDHGSALFGTGKACVRVCVLSAPGLSKCASDLSEMHNRYALCMSLTSLEPEDLLTCLATCVPLHGHTLHGHEGVCNHNACSIFVAKGTRGICATLYA